MEKLKDSLPEDIVQHITERIKTPLGEGGNDITYWSIESSSNFTVKSTWEFMRTKLNRTFTTIYGKKDCLSRSVFSCGEF